MRTGTRTLVGARHPLLARFREAWRRGELTEDGCCAVEGLHLVEEAFRSPVEVVALLAARSAEERLEQFEAAANGRVRSYLTSDRLFRSLAPTETPQGIAALVRLREHSLDDDLARANALVAVLIGVQDPGNLGTVLRSLEAFGGAACLLGVDTVSPFNPKAVRASAGSVFRVPVYRRLSVEEIFRACKRHGLQTIALARDGGRRLPEADLTGPVALLVGREGSGLPDEVVSRAEIVARIPITAGVESLNAAVAASLALYEAARQRGFAG